MTCSGCAHSVKLQLSKIEGVNEVNVDLNSGTAQITMSAHIPIEKFREALKGTSYAIEEQTA